MSQKGNYNKPLSNRLQKLNFNDIVKSTLTEEEYDDDTILLIQGKYHGTPLGDIPASYLLWLDVQEWMKDEKLRQYINDLRSELEKERDEERNQFKADNY